MILGNLDVDIVTSIVNMDITSDLAIASASIDQLLDVVLYARQWLTVAITVIIILAENQVA